MAAMKWSAVRKPKDRWLMDLILLFIPSTAPLEMRCLVHARIPSRCPRSTRTNFLNGSNRERVHPLAEIIVGHFQTVHPREIAARKTFEAAQEFGLHVAHRQQSPRFRA